VVAIAALLFSFGAILRFSSSWASMHRQPWRYVLYAGPEWLAGCRHCQQRFEVLLAFCHLVVAAIGVNISISAAPKQSA
jgi:hypothetical protein